MNQDVVRILTFAITVFLCVLFFAGGLYIAMSLLISGKIIAGIIAWAVCIAVIMTFVKEVC